MDGIQPVMSMNPNGGNSFGESWIFLFAILALMWGGGGLFGNGNGRCATVEDLNNSANFTRLENQVMNNGNRIENKADYITNGLATLGYEIAQSFACTNANTTAQIQKVLDRLCAGENAALQNRVNQLELQQAVAGVVRYPNSIAYSAGASPFCANACACGGYAI